MDLLDKIFLGWRLPLKIYTATMVYRPLPPFIMDSRQIQSGRRDASAQPISSADSGERSVAQRGGHGRQPGLSSGRFVVADAAIYCVQGWILDIYPINQQDECFGGSIVLHMHRISLGIVEFEWKGVEVVEQ